MQTKPHHAILLVVLASVLMATDAPPPNAVWAAYYDGITTAANTVIASAKFSKTTQPMKLSWVSTRAGSDGAHNFSFDVFDATAAAVLCSKTSVLCTSALGTTQLATCTSVAAVVSNTIQLRIDVSACTGTIPLGTITAELN